MIKTDSIAPPASSATGLSRRGIFALAGASAALAATPATARTFGSGFTHCVASGEPQANSVLLWTRYVADGETRLEWQVSESAEFTSIVAEGEATASPARDYCVKDTASGLAPDRWYFYRFIAPDGTFSPTGRTRTLPQGPTEKFRMAVFSCSNYGFGYFNAYAHAAEANDVDLAVHLGDYIYEYGAGTYPSVQQVHPDRGDLNPSTEIVALADYRLRYATYRADKDLQRLHQVLPMIAVWDDHESTNDSWKDGAQNHQSETEGEWSVRKRAFTRAYREWLPVSEEPYKAYNVGDLATLLCIDTRIEGREEQFNIRKLVEGKDDPEALMAALTAFRDGAYADPDRQLLGVAQESWLAENLAASTARGATWQVLVQQVLMGKVKAATSLIDQLGDDTPFYVRSYIETAAKAAQVGLPQNMDAWDGYPAARERVFKSALEVDANLLVLAGDTHNAWAFDLAQEGENVGIELGVCSVSSPGMENYLRMIPGDELAAALVETNEELKWVDTSHRGYMAIELTPSAAITEYRFMSGIRQRSTQLAGTKRIVSQAGSNTVEI